MAVGQTDRLRGEPFYRSYAGDGSAWEGVGGRDGGGGGAGVVVTPVTLDPAMGEELYYAGRESALRPLIEAMDAYLAGLPGIGRRGEVSLPDAGAPKLFVGSSEAEAAPAAAAQERTEYDKYPPMVIHIERGSAAWRSEAARAADGAGADRMLLVRLGLTEYPKADRGFFGKKVVLGTGYEEPIRFLSAEDVPVEVLQVMGLLLDRQGNVVRAGAEGILSKDSPFWVQIFGARQRIDDEALRRLVEEERREDLPGEPLKWEVAVHNLVSQLLQRPADVIR